jgi:multiple sugar transport system permease protein
MSVRAGQVSAVRPWRTRLAVPLRGFRGVLLYSSVLAVCATVLFPVYWMLVTTVRPARYTISYPPAFLPQEINWGAYHELFATIPLAIWLRNTMLVSAGVTLIALVFSTAGAYALSSFNWRGRSLFGFSLLSTQLLPEALLVIPIFVIFRSFGLLNSLHGLAVADAAFVVPVTTWILKGFFDTIPREVREAALVDGCTSIGVLWRIILPLSLPALVAISVIAFFDGWNEYLFAATLVSSSELRLVSVGLASFIGELATPVELVFAAAVIFTVPPIVFYFAVQRFLISGLTGGAVKG